MATRVGRGVGLGAGAGVGAGATGVAGAATFLATTLRTARLFVMVSTDLAMALGFHDHDLHVVLGQIFFCEFELVDRRCFLHAQFFGEFCDWVEVNG